jgi:hypothetical protein
VHLTEGLFRFGDDTIAFVIAHEIAHAKLKHIRDKRAVSLATTGVMIIAGAIIPGLGFLNYAVNPAVTNNYGKGQEYETDKLASETVLIFRLIVKFKSFNLCKETPKMPVVFGINIHHGLTVLRTLRKRLDCL